MFNLNTTTANRADTVDAGLSAHLRQVFNYMTGGVALSGLVAWVVSLNPSLIMPFAQNQWLMLGLMFALLGLSLFTQARIMSLQPGTALGLFVLYSAGMGFAMAPIFLVYTGGLIATAFFTAAAMFGGASLYGYVTKKDLSGMRGLLIMAIWGLVAASLLNMFIGGSGMSLVISYIAVPIFTVLTAVSMQDIKNIYHQVGHDETNRTRVAILGAVWLYISFMAIFQHLLHILGSFSND